MYTVYAAVGPAECVDRGPGEFETCGAWLYSVTPHSLGEISYLSVIQKKRKKVKKCSNVSSIKDVFPS